MRGAGRQLGGLRRHQVDVANEDDRRSELVGDLACRQRLLDAAIELAGAVDVRRADLSGPADLEPEQRGARRWSRSARARCELGLEPTEQRVILGKVDAEGPFFDHAKPGARRRRQGGQQHECERGESHGPWIPRSARIFINFGHSRPDLRVTSGALSYPRSKLGRGEALLPVRDDGLGEVDEPARGRAQLPQAGQARPAGEAAARQSVRHRPRSRRARASRPMPT